QYDTWEPVVYGCELALEIPERGSGNHDSEFHVQEDSDVGCNRHPDGCCGDLFAQALLDEVLEREREGEDERAGGQYERPTPWQPEHQQLHGRDVRNDLSRDVGTDQDRGEYNDVTGVTHGSFLRRLLR